MNSMKVGKQLCFKANIILHNIIYIYTLHILQKIIYFYRVEIQIGVVRFAVLIRINEKIIFK